VNFTIPFYYLDSLSLLTCFNLKLISYTVLHFRVTNWVCQIVPRYLWFHRLLVWPNQVLLDLVLVGHFSLRVRHVLQFHSVWVLMLRPDIYRTSWDQNCRYPFEIPSWFLLIPDFTTPPITLQSRGNQWCMAQKYKEI